MISLVEHESTLPGNLTPVLVSIKNEKSAHAHVFIPKHSKRPFMRRMESESLIYDAKEGVDIPDEILPGFTNGAVKPALKEAIGKRGVQRLLALKRNQGSNLS